MLDVETIPSPLWVPPEQKPIGVRALRVAEELKAFLAKNGTGLLHQEIVRAIYVERLVEASRADAGLSAFPPIAAHLPVVICTRTINSLDGSGERQAFVIDEPGGTLEAGALLYIADRGAKADRIITFNGRAFDMPVMQERAMGCGFVNGEWAWALDKRRRFPGPKDNWGPLPPHVDMLEQLGDYGATRAISLDQVATLTLKLEGKCGSGEKVADLWAQGRKEELVRYCRRDVDLTWAVYVRWAQSVGIEPPQMSSTIDFEELQVAA